MHVVADRPTIVSALPAPTSTCVRRKTHNACWRISCNTELRVLEQAGAEAENRRAAPRAANHALARWPSPSADNAAQALRLPRCHDSLLHASIRRAHHHSATPAFPKNVSGTHARTSGGQPTAIPSYQTSATAGRITGPGTIALQTHDAKSAVLYKNIRIRPLD